ERELLAHVAHALLPLLGVLDDVEAAEAGDASRVGREQAGEHADRGRLAGAVRSEKAEDLPARHVEAHAVGGDERAEPAGDVAHFDERVHHAASSPWSTNTSSSDGRISATSDGATRPDRAARTSSASAGGAPARPRTCSAVPKSDTSSIAARSRRR